MPMVSYLPYIIITCAVAHYPFNSVNSGNPSIWPAYITCPRGAHFILPRTSPLALHIIVPNVVKMSDKKDPVLESIAQTKAHYKRLGKSGLRVSVPIFGAMSFGHPDWQPWVLDEEKVQTLFCYNGTAY